MSIQNDIYTGGENLEVMQEAKNYNEFLVNLVLSHKPEGAMNVVDFGAGIGTFAKKLRELDSEPLCVEVDAIQREILREQSFKVYANIINISSEFAKIDYVYSLNVLEHIHDDIEVLNQISQALTPGGTVLIYVPAFNCLFSSMDRLVGHIRRYRKSELIEKVRRCGLVICNSSYVDSVGFFASLLLKYFGSDSGRLSRRAVRIFDRYIFPISKILDRVFGKIFGKNVYVVAKKLC